MANAHWGIKAEEEEESRCSNFEIYHGQWPILSALFKLHLPSFLHAQDARNYYEFFVLVQAV